MAELRPGFWENIPLVDLNEAEWEALCDGCGRCCLVKLEDIDTGELHFTSLACEQLNIQQCRCSNYENRLNLVNDCLQVSVEILETVAWLPSTCAYRLRHENKALAAWHPLISGDPKSVHRVGISVRHQATSERNVGSEDYPDYVVHWVE